MYSFFRSAQESGAAEGEAVASVVSVWANATRQALAALNMERVAMGSLLGLRPTDVEVEGMCDAASLALAKVLKAEIISSRNSDNRSSKSSSKSRSSRSRSSSSSSSRLTRVAMAIAVTATA